MSSNKADLERYVTDDEHVGSSSTQPTRAEHGLLKVQPISKSELQPSYAQDLGVASVTHGWYGGMINCLGAVAKLLIEEYDLSTCPNPFKEVKQGSVGLVSRFAVDPGLCKINPFSEELRRVDVKIQLAALPRQTVMTKDNVNVMIDSVIYYHISSPVRAAFSVSDVHQALVERAQTTLRHVIGARNLQTLLTDRESVASEIEGIVEDVSERWGVQVEAILLKDILFSQELQQSLSSAAQQKRIGESKVIAARAEVDAAVLMREAADILSSQAAMQIRQLEALQNMARSSNAKTIFVPMNLFQAGQFEGATDISEGGSAGARHHVKASTATVSDSPAGKLAMLKNLAEEE